MPHQEAIYDLKVSLLGIEPEIWRRILVPSDITLPKLHLTVQVAMGWTNSHLHQFIIDNNRYGVVDPDWDDEVVDERRKRLHQFLREPFDRLVYEYDFGDGWEHELVLEDSFEPMPSQAVPVCIGGRRACPPEDVGGIPGYSDFLESVRDSRHPEHEQNLAWIGGYFDPESFNIHETNVTLGRCFPRGA